MTLRNPMVWLSLGVLVTACTGDRGELASAPSEAAVPTNRIPIPPEVLPRLGGTSPLPG